MNDNYFAMLHDRHEYIASLRASTRNTLEEQILKDHYDSNDVKASIEQEGSLDRWSKTDMVAFLVSGTFGG